MTNHLHFKVWHLKLKHVSKKEDDIEIMDINTLADRKGFDRCGIALAIIRKI
ncbi:hypothetical protein [Corynebacterium ulcerans]|uniref:hypothetical protein n=1 Tax=Corynebacterium ulcerans TaxID=65058 RepID=UPI0013054360|nr:hypothetical protein [Corynebacterium ulcerans]